MKKQIKLIMIGLILLLIPITIAMNETTNQTEVQEQPYFKIVVFGDTQQYSYSEGGMKHLKNVTNWIVNNSKPDLILHVGDFLDGGSEVGLDKYNFFNNLSIPFVSCSGNGEEFVMEKYYKIFGNESYYKFDNISIITVDWKVNETIQQELLNITKEKINETFIVLIHDWKVLINGFYNQENVLLVQGGHYHSHDLRIINNTYMSVSGDVDSGKFRTYSFYKDYILANSYSPTTNLTYIKFNMTYQNKTINYITDGVYVPKASTPQSSGGSNSNGGGNTELKLKIKLIHIPQIKLYPKMKVDYILKEN